MASFWQLVWKILIGDYPRLPKKVPVFSKADKVPYISELSQQRLVLFYAFLPVVTHQAILGITSSQQFNPVFAFIIYFYTWQLSARHRTYSFRKLGVQIGFFDGDEHERDNSFTKSKGPSKAIRMLLAIAGIRTAMPILVAFHPNKAPIQVLGDIEWWLWLFFNITIYSVVPDFWYYLVHRAAHEVPALWRFHRKHHTSKHPNVSLTSYADFEQEIWDLFGAPFLAYLTMRSLGIPFDFFAWWICLQYIAHTEVAGHSGVRMHLSPPLTLSPLLRLFDADLSIEDHDLHHRRGWRRAQNYGKQTRVWDRLFGTSGKRIESTASNIDYSSTVHLSFFEGM